MGNFYYYPDVAKEAFYEVYHALLDGDKVKLKSLLCKGLQEQKDVDSQIDAFMDAIGGRLVFADEDSYRYHKLGAARDDGETDEYTLLNTFSQLRNITDNNGNAYGMFGVAYMHYYKTHPEQIGVYSVSLSVDGFNRTYVIAHEDYK